MGKYLADSYDAALRENADLKTRLAEAETQNRVMWDVASDREARLAEAEALLREAQVELIGDPWGGTIRAKIAAFLTPDSATHRETAND